MKYDRLLFYYFDSSQRVMPFGLSLIRYTKGRNDSYTLAIRYSVLIISVPFPVYVFASPNLAGSVRANDKTLGRGCGALGDTVHE